MCGITGIFRGVPGSEPLNPALQQMADSIIHRGPDDSGVWEEPSVGLARISHSHPASLADWAGGRHGRPVAALIA